VRSVCVCGRLHASALKCCISWHLQGFRRYLRIRETLCHELAHMVWSEHDNNFKQLNSQLLREVEAADWVSRPGTSWPSVTYVGVSASKGSSTHGAAPSCAGSSVGRARECQLSLHNIWVLLLALDVIPVPHSGCISAGHLMANSAAESLSGWVDPDDVMAVTAQSSGRTLGSGQPGAAAAGSTSAAAAAALRRSQAALPQPTPHASAAGSGVQSLTVTEPEIEGLGHRDRQTEQLERALRRLGSSDADAAMPDARAVAEAQSRDGVDAATEPTAVHALAEQQTEQDKAAAEKASPVAEDPSDPPQAAPVEHPSVSAEGSTAADAPAKAAHVEEPEPSGSGQNDATSIEQRFSQAKRAVHELRSAAASQEEASTALQTLQTILRNALNAPQDDRYRRLRPRNPAFARRLGRFPQALEVLHVAGFQEAARSSEDPVLALQRTDPGLLWLALEAVQTAMASG